jgi:L-alanine-DL-glutamate epimerase-like enolase superfamily enzyme
MKIVAIETLCAQEFENVLWVRVHTDAGVIGLGETFYGAGAVASHIHETLATRLLGRDPLRIEAIHKELVNLPMAQSSTGAEYRAASAIDIALWDLWGKATNQSVHQRPVPATCLHRSCVSAVMRRHYWRQHSSPLPVATFQDCRADLSQIQHP